ncbi:unnamed protein product [Linum trigynum]|uniref:Uncharacterized protein n=1 Tax=Linum trigynum TaxID=586398 RepID=A0AAV2DVW2_9ROSI
MANESGCWTEEQEGDDPQKDRKGGNYVQINEKKMDGAGLGGWRHYFLLGALFGFRWGVRSATRWRSEVASAGRQQLLSGRLGVRGGPWVVDL